MKVLLKKTKKTELNIVRYVIINISYINIF